MANLGGSVTKTAAARRPGAGDVGAERVEVGYSVGRARPAAMCCRAGHPGSGDSSSRGRRWRRTSGGYEAAVAEKIPLIIGPRRPGDAEILFSSTAKAERELNWRAKYGIEEMCRDQWNWASKNPYGYGSPDSTKQNGHHGYGSADAPKQNGHHGCGSPDSPRQNGHNGYGSPDSRQNGHNGYGPADNTKQNGHNGYGPADSKQNSNGHLH